MIIIILDSFYNQLIDIMEIYLDELLTLYLINRNRNYYYVMTEDYYNLYRLIMIDR